MADVALNNRLVKDTYCLSWRFFRACLRKLPVDVTREWVGVQEEFRVTVLITRLVLDGEK